MYTTFFPLIMLILALCQPTTVGGFTCSTDIDKDQDTAKCGFTFTKTNNTRLLNPVTKDKQSSCGKNAAEACCAENLKAKALSLEEFHKSCHAPGTPGVAPKANNGGGTAPPTTANTKDTSTKDTSTKDTSTKDTSKDTTKDTSKDTLKQTKDTPPPAASKRA